MGAVSHEGAPLWEQIAVAEAKDKAEISSHKYEPGRTVVCDEDFPQPTGDLSARLDPARRNHHPGKPRSTVHPAPSAKALEALYRFSRERDEARTRYHLRPSPPPPKRQRTVAEASCTAVALYAVQPTKTYSPSVIVLDAKRRTEGRGALGRADNKTKTSVKPAPTDQPQRKYERNNTGKPDVSHGAHSDYQPTSVQRRRSTPREKMQTKHSTTE
jgi:hypothetical protein